MVEEIFNEMKRAYSMGKMITSMKDIFREASGDEEVGDLSAYDLRLVSVYFTDLGDEEDKTEHQLLQVRIRHMEDMEEGQEEIVLVFNTYGAHKPLEDVDEDLRFAAKVIENYTEKFVGEFPDAVLRWDFMGDDEEEEEEHYERFGKTIEEEINDTDENSENNKD